MQNQNDHNSPINVESDFDSLIKLGKSYYQSGFIDKAVNEFKKAIEINPNSAEAHFSLGYIYSEKYIFTGSHID